MKIKVFILLVFVVVLIPFGTAWSITLVRVGYIDIDAVVETYTNRYLETEIAMRQALIQQLRDTYKDQSYDMSVAERMDLQRQIDDQKEALSLLMYNSYLFETTGDIRDSIIIQIVQHDIMEAIKKTSELEGFSLVLDNSGNFVYGSEKRIFVLRREGRDGEPRYEKIKPTKTGNYTYHFNRWLKLATMPEREME